MKVGPVRQEKALELAVHVAERGWAQPGAHMRQVMATVGTVALVGPNAAWALRSATGK